MSDTLREAALEYHRTPTPGKISVVPTKAMATQRDLALAYSPGVADACMAIVENPLQAAELTARSNLVAVITNGSAVLGLGNIGPLAGKPVMEGKGCLFKKFAGIDVFDIELAETDPDALVDTIARMEPTFGGINLEDIKAPECFYIEQKLRERMKIPVFHDDQHGTAIVAAAAVLNGLKLVGKKIAEIKLVCSGRWGRRAGVPRSDRKPGPQEGKHSSHRRQGCRVRRAQRGHGREQGAVCRGNGREDSGGRRPQRRRFPWALSGGRSETRYGEADGA
jgi:malic enzyme